MAKAGSTHRELEIVELAEAIAEEYSSSGRLDPLSVADDEGITTSFNNYSSSFDGMLEHRAGRFHIYCNLDRVGYRDSPRARFTLCHELGHYFIDEHRNALASGKAPAHPSRCEYESKNIVERQADLFASRLLMPKGKFLKASARHKIGLASILAMTEHFGTSVTSTAIRYVDSDILPCAVMKWGPDGLTWKSFSTDTFRARFRKTVETVDKLADDCATKRALRGEPVPQAGFFEQGTTVAAWFPFVRSGEGRNDILIEQAVALGRFGVLTFIFPAEGKYSS
jgi:Zn-dependent peptidase ImmA (M78 family)